MNTRCLISLLVLAFVGCNTLPTYRIRTNVPWPDEWAAGPRHPDHTELALTPRAVAWHRQANMEKLEREVQRLAAKYAGSLVMTRVCFADLRTKPGRDKYALRFLEVRITAWPLPASLDLAKHDWPFEETSLTEAVQRCAQLLGTEIRFADDVARERPSDFVASQWDAPTALAGMLLRHGLYFAPTCLGTSVVRSYEFEERFQFIRVVRRRLREAAAAQQPGPYTVMPLAEWVELHVDALARIMPQSHFADDSAGSGRERLVAEAQRHLLRMLELRLAPE